MTADQFKAALVRGAAASPFTGVVTVKLGTESITVPSCQVKLGTNDVEHKEYGDELVRTIAASIPKEHLTRRPEVARDLILSGTREFKIKSVEGDDECSPFWIIKGSAPI